MATEIWLTKSAMGHLVPCTDQDREALSHLSADEWHLASFRMPRNVKHHKKWFALLQAVYPHQSMWPTFKKFREKVQEALGLGEYHTDGRGERYFEAESISFSKMDQTEFSDFYERGVELILTRILPNVGRDDLDRQVHDILAGRNANPERKAA